MLKKTLSILLSFLLILFCSTKVFAAPNLGTLSCWYSDSDIIGRWDTSNVQIYKVQYSENDSFYFSSGLAYACIPWSNDTEINISSGTSSSYASAPIVYYGGTMEQLNALTDFTISQLTNGITTVNFSAEGYWSYGTETKLGWVITGAEGCIVDKDHSTNEVTNTCIHELGHALGWHGHSNVSSDIMSEYGSSNILLTDRDKNHLSQVYSEGGNTQ